MQTVSVIIPTWNRRKKVIKAILSALNQTILPFEILVCDDGSTDNTFKIVKSIKDKRIKWLSGKHTGLPAVVRNNGIKKSHGDWIAFLDSDDQWLPKKLALQIRTAEKIKSKAICSNAYALFPNRKIFSKKKMVKKNLKKITFDDLLVSNRIICSSVIIHSSLIKKTVGFPDVRKLKAIEDYAFWLRIASQTDFLYIHKPLVIYNDDIKNSIRSEGFLWQQQIQVFKNFLNWSNNQTKLKPFRDKVKQQLYILAENHENSSHS